jgi:hypothetical protein
MQSGKLARCEFCGRKVQHFDSKREATYYVDLRLQEKAGAIRDLECQPKFPIVVNNRKITVYRGDFAFRDTSYRVADVKGLDTQLSKIKRKLVSAVHGVDVEIWK